MTRRRTDIFKRVRSLLLNKTGAGTNVSVFRDRPEWEEDLPAINVYPAQGENVEIWAQAPREMKHTLLLNVEVTDRQNTSLELFESLNLLEEQVRAVLDREAASPEPLNCLVEDMVLQSVDFDNESGGDGAIGSARVVYEVCYIQPALVTDSALNVGNLAGIDVDWLVGRIGDEPDPEVKAEDTIDY